MENKIEKKKRQKADVKAAIKQREAELEFIKDEIKLRNDALAIQIKYPTILEDKATFAYELNADYIQQRIAEFKFNHKKKMFELQLQLDNHKKVLSELKVEMRS